MSLFQICCEQGATCFSSIYCISIRFLLSHFKKTLEIVSFSLQKLVTHKKHTPHNTSNSAGKINISIF